MRGRLLFAVPGLVAALYGARLLFETGWKNVWDTVVWAAGGVFVHDGLLAPVVLVGCIVAARLLPDRLRGPGVIVLVVLGSVTVVAIPVLGRFGARADNPSLLDRNYWAGWWVVAGLTLGGALVLAVWDARKRNHQATTRGGDGQGSRS